MQKTKIDWCDFSANPFSGCTHGCPFCYARRFATRLSGVKGTPYHRLKEGGFDPFDPSLHLDVLEKLDAKLTRRRKGARVFLGSMGDLGCDSPFVVTTSGARTILEARERESVKRAIAKLIAKHPRHTFLILTKNPEGLRGTWPENAHIGVSVATEQEARERVPALFGAVQAGTRWLSVEPLRDPEFNPLALSTDTVVPDWVVIGAETGTSRRRVMPDKIVYAARTIYTWCNCLNIPCFVKDNLRLAFPALEWPQDLPR